jgi:hypothetical protein
MFVLEVLGSNNEWETVAEFFESAEDAEVYYRCQVSGCEDFRVVEAE